MSFRKLSEIPYLFACAFYAFMRQFFVDIDAVHMLE